MGEGGYRQNNLDRDHVDHNQIYHASPQCHNDASNNHEDRDYIPPRL